MAGRIVTEDVALVRERSRIEDVVGERVQLKSAGGGNLKGLCPFHDEKSPSFQVSPAKGLYYCFGCGEGGDVIGFLRAVDHLSFAEAVEHLAGRVGVQLRYEEAGSAPGRQQGQRTRLVAAHAAAAAYFQEQLGSAEAAIGRTFLTDRGFDQAAAEHFGVGYAPQGWDNLTRHLRGKGFGEDELLASGLLVQGNRGVYDRFRGRLLWPIRDLAGDVVGFGARRLHETDEGPKYLNTPETAIYKKSHVLYGLDLAKRDVAKQQQAVVVEGYTDVMACHLAGVTTAIATCGTSFGAEHIKVLRRLLMDDDTFRGEVVFTFDGDAAGQKAALRAFGEDQRFVARTFVAVEPTGLDPCDLRLQHGDEAVRALVERRLPLFEFAIRSVLATHDLTTPEGRIAALNEAAPVVAQIRDQSLRPEYARSLGGWLGMEIGPVVAAVQQAARAGSRTASRPATSSQGTETTTQPAAGTAGLRRPDPADRVAAVDREALKVCLQVPGLVDDGWAGLGPEAFPHPTYAAVARAVHAAGGPAHGAETPQTWVDAVRAACEDDVSRSLVTELAVEPLRVDGAVDSRYVGEQVARIRERVVTKQVVELRSQLQRVDPSDTTEYNRVFAELLSLEQVRRDLREVALGAK